MPLDIRKRGLAVTAVTALALAGLTVAPASAQGPVDEDGIVLLTPYGAGTPLSAQSTDPDDGRRDVNLVAEVADPTATVTFEYTTDTEPATDSTWTAIGESSVIGGFASTSWSIPAELDGTSVALRVTATPSDSAEDSAIDVDANVAIAPASGTDAPQTVELTSTEGRYFPQPYAGESQTGQLMRVRGEVSADSGTVELSRWRSSDGTFTGATDASVYPDFGKDDQRGLFDAAYDLAGDGSDGGTVALRAERDTDDVRAITLTEQRLTTTSVFAYNDAPRGRAGHVVMEVRDQNGQPVIGAQVFHSVDEAAVGELAGYTNVYGQLEVPQDGGSTAVYWANTTDDDSRNPGDPETTFTLPTYEQEARDVESYLADGDLFDRDEFEPGDVAITVTDQRGRPMYDSTKVEYRAYPIGSEPPTEWESTTTDDEGRAPLIPEDFVADGTYTVDYRLPVEPTEENPEPEPIDQGSVELTIGEAVLSLDPAIETVRAASGGAVDYTGSLTIGDEPLVGRAIDLEYVRGVENVPGRRADAGIVTDEGRVLTQQVTTDEDGGFSVRVKDTREQSEPAELGGSLLVATGDTVATEGNTLAGNADESTESGVDFGSGRGEVTLRRGGSGNGRSADVLFVRGPGSVGGETIRVFRLDGDRRARVAERVLNTDGDANGLRIADLNDGRVTTYVVALVPSDRVKATETRPLRLR